MKSGDLIDHLEDDLSEIEYDCLSTDTTGGIPWFMLEKWGGRRK